GAGGARLRADEVDAGKAKRPIPLGTGRWAVAFSWGGLVGEDGLHVEPLERAGRAAVIDLHARVDRGAAVLHVQATVPGGGGLDEEGAVAGRLGCEHPVLRGDAAAGVDVDGARVGGRVGVDALGGVALHLDQPVRAVRRD